MNLPAERDLLLRDIEDLEKATEALKRQGQKLHMFLRKFMALLDHPQISKILSVRDVTKQHRSEAISPSAPPPPLPPLSCFDHQGHDGDHGDEHHAEEKARSIEEKRCWPQGDAGLKARANALAHIFRQHALDAVLDDPSQDSNAQMPLVTPKNLLALGDALDTDLRKEPFLVLTCKRILGDTLAKAYRDRDLGSQDVEQALNMLDDERKNVINRGASNSQAQSVAGLASCVECSSQAVCYCLECEDTFCNSCFLKLHAKGNRAKHTQLDVNMAGFTIAQKLQSDNMIHQTSNDWHSFIDSSGLIYQYNFSTAETKRNSVLDRLQDLKQ